MELKPRKAKSDAIEAIRNIRSNMIKMLNTNTKAKRYTGDSKWIESEEFTALSHKRMKK